MNFYIVYYLMGIIMLPGLIFAIIAQIKVNNAYNNSSKIPSENGKSAKEVAREVLDKNGLQHINIESIDGTLTDNYDPQNDIIHLSKKVYNGTDIASVGVALHEVGHAIQHEQGYAPAKIRLAIIPFINFSSSLLWPLIMIGFLFNIFAGFDNIVGRIFIWCGIFFFALSILFSLITLPTELDASKRARQELSATGNFTDRELLYVKQVLDAAALTYIASLVTSILTLLRFILTILVIKNDR